MTSPANATQFTAGALVSVAADGTKRSIPFQYNPETLRFTFEPNTVGGTPAGRSQAVRFAGAASQAISLECRISAADGLDAGDPVVTRYGIAPQLALLQLLAYPSTADVAATQAQLDTGTIEVVPLLADRLLFVWGEQRVVPCRITSLTITEELYDSDLSPVLATVALSLRALSYSDVEPSNPGYQEFVAYQQNLERLAGLVTPQGPT